MIPPLTKNILKIFFVLLLFTTLSPFVYAESGTYVPLTPSKEFGSTACNPSKPTITDPNDPNKTIPDPACSINIIGYIPKVFTLAIGVAGALAVIMIMIGGIEYITSDTIGGKSDGKQRITNAVIGLLLAIGAYIILYTINKNALEFDLNKINIAPPVVTAPSTPQPTAGSCAITSACRGNACLSQCALNSAWPDDFAWRTQLTSSGIQVTGTGTAQPCNIVGQNGCTSVYLLGNNAIQGLIALKNACPTCTITVTGGTEFWEHQSHGPLNSRVDLRLVSGANNLDAFIKSKTPLTANTCFPGQPAWQFNGDQYVLENNTHWHVCY